MRPSRERKGVAAVFGRVRRQHESAQPVRGIERTVHSVPASPSATGGKVSSAAVIWRTATAICWPGSFFYFRAERSVWSFIGNALPHTPLQLGAVFARFRISSAESLASPPCLVRADGAARLRRSAAPSADICRFVEIYSVKPSSLRSVSRRQPCQSPRPESQPPGKSR